MSGEALRRMLGRASTAWGISVRNARTGAVLFEHEPARVLQAASVGKLLLLAFVGYELLCDRKSARTKLSRSAVDGVADSGIWQHLEADALSVTDLATLVFAASDNLATNVLLNHFGLERVREIRTALGLRRTDLLDMVRDIRGPGDIETLSRAAAEELSDFMGRVARGELISVALSRWMHRGMSLNADLSMVPAPLGVDPLAHACSGSRDGPPVANKTGTDAGVHADTGIIHTGSREIAYAAICNHEPSVATHREVMETMRAIGEAMMEL